MPRPRSLPFLHFEPSDTPGLLGVGNAGGLTGEPGGRGNLCPSLFDSSSFVVGGSKFIPPRRAWRADIGAAVPLDPRPGLRSTGLNLFSP